MNNHTLKWKVAVIGAGAKDEHAIFLWPGNA